MASNGRNRGSNYGPPAPPDDHSLWISAGNPYFDHVTSRGVSVDSLGNVWIADTFNSRVLRFPPGSTHADPVLGQPDFSSSGCVPDGPLDRMCTPTLARVHPTTGELYVPDEFPAPFFARMLVFTPPFSNGMAASRTIEPLLPASDHLEHDGADRQLRQALLGRYPRGDPAGGRGRR